ncbi:MAG: AAA family ATPase [Planctomycetota bacterium]|jgi:predicted ATPase|nr:AAA family ATPase [Planctomycetota bacterium]
MNNANKNKNRLLDSFHIDSFRGLRNLHLDGLRDVNIFVGKNNCGKTSALEAIALYMLPFQSGKGVQGILNPITMQRKSALTYNQNIGLDYRWLFPQSGSADRYISMHSESGSILLKSFRGELNENDDVSFSFTTTKEEKSFAPLLKMNLYYKFRDTPNKDKEFPAELNFTNIDSHRINIDFVKKGLPNKGIKECSCQLLTDEQFSDTSLMLKYLTDIDGTSDKIELIHLLQEYDDNILDVRIGVMSDNSSGTCVLLNHKKTGTKTPLFSMGNGFVRVFTIMVYAFWAKNGVLLIDEIDNGLHYSMLKETLLALFKFCQVRHIQLFITTHSLETIDMANKCLDEMNDFKLGCHLIKHENNEYKVIRYDHKKLSILRNDYGVEVRS